MAFKNTVDKVGDAALTRSIIGRSITELNCNITTSIRQYAFQACTALKSVNFPSVTSVALGAFRNCSALEKAEFGAAADFGNNAFYGCSKLGTVILRNADQLCTLTGTPFANTPIASGTGYIYVPAALVDQYKASWTTYAAQFRAIEDYPGVVDPYSWTGVAANIANGSYANVYNVGDLVPLNLGTEGVVNMQIAGINVDDLADGSGKAPITWISKELLSTPHSMNVALVTNSDGTYQEGTGAIGGWEKCEMRAYLANTIKPMIPENVRNMICAVVKTHNSYNTSGVVETQTTEDEVWIPGYNEMVGNSSLYYPLFKNSYANRIKYVTNSTKKNDWWLRDVSTAATRAWWAIFDDGKPDYMYEIVSESPALGFCT